MMAPVPLLIFFQRVSCTVLFGVGIWFGLMAGCGVLRKQFGQKANNSILPRRFGCSFGGTGCSLGRVISDFVDMVFERVECKMMKRQKTLTAFIVFVLLLCSILAVTYGSL